VVVGEQWQDVQARFHQRRFASRLWSTARRLYNQSDLMGAKLAFLTFWSKGDFMSEVFADRLKRQSEEPAYKRKF